MKAFGERVLIKSTLVNLSTSGIILPNGSDNADWKRTIEVIHLGEAVPEKSNIAVGDRIILHEHLIPNKVKEIEKIKNKKLIYLSIVNYDEIIGQYDEGDDEYEPTKKK